MSDATLAKLGRILPTTTVFLIHGLTEAFRTIYLPPEKLDAARTSIGKAISSAEMLARRPDGTPCGPDKLGEFVYRGALVLLGYSNDPERSTERFRPVPPVGDGLPLGRSHFVHRDAECLLYFLGRLGKMIKSSKLRVSRTEVTEEAGATGLAADTVFVGVPHKRLGQGIVLVAPPAPRAVADADALGALRHRLRRSMVRKISIGKLKPRDAIGKAELLWLGQKLAYRFADAKPEYSSPA